MVNGEFFLGYTMKENIVKNKSFAFAVRAVRLHKFLCEKKKEFILSQQLMRSATSTGAMVREAEHAQSKADFISKLAIAQKEMNECMYWLDLLLAGEYLDAKEHQSMFQDADEVMRLLTSILKTAKENKKKTTTDLNFFR
jgi:four helix bundle protein